MVSSAERTDVGELQHLAIALAERGADILPIDWRQCVGRPLSQAAQDPQLPRVEMTTWSPTDTPATPSPSSVTMPVPS
jgi:hypothetical protein